MPSPADQAVIDAIFLNSSVKYGPPVDISAITDDAVTSEMLQCVKKLEVQGVRAAESGDLNQAVALFDEAIAMMPKRASGFNNRAQALRLMGQNERAMDDLNHAISLSHVNTSGRVNALCQRALVHRLNGDEEKSMSDLETAASAGHEFAKRALVKLNPYSALCNEMLHQMIEKLNEFK